MMLESNRRNFLKGLGAFLILPGAGRIWKAVKPPFDNLLLAEYELPQFRFIPTFTDFMREREEAA